MPNVVLTKTQVTRKALQVLHQKLNFVGSINRQYDDSYAQEGAKIGDTLKIRLPNQYTVTTGATMTAQETSETSVDLVMSTQKHVGMNFTMKELTLSLDDFSDRIIDPAMAVLAASIEADAMTMYKDVYQQVTNNAAALTFAKVLAGKKVLTDALTPNSKRVANLNTQDMVDMITDTKGLFQDSGEIASQYRDGMMGRSGGFDFYENTLWPSHPRSAANGAYLTNGVAQTGSSLIVDTGANAPVAGDIFTIAGVFKVHPETKASTGILQQFVIGSGATTTLFPFSPAIVATGARQNVSNAAADNSAITFAGAASTNYGISMLYHPNAFAFVTADLMLPKDAHFAERATFDGISLRLWQASDIVNDQLATRVDVLYGFKAIRPQLACRSANN